MRLVAGVLHITGVASNCYAGDKMVCMQINTKMPTGNKKIYFDGNIQTFGVRSGEHDLNNIYLDFLDKNGTHCYIGFMTEGTKGVVFYSGNKLIWKITV